MTSTSRVEVTTTIKVPREHVFDAWLTADRMARFLCAGDTHVASVEVDPRVGGAFRVVMANAKGSYDHRGRYVVISGNYMVVSEWTFRVVQGSASLPKAANEVALAAAVVGSAGCLSWLVWRLRPSARPPMRSM